MVGGLVWCDGVLRCPTKCTDLMPGCEGSSWGAAKGGGVTMV